MDHPLWTQLADRAGFELSKSQRIALDDYLQLLLEANRNLNLTRISDPRSAEVLHVGDALTLLPFLPPGAHALADVGSGGGVPGMVLAVARADVAVALIESTRKKADFLRQCATRLDLANVRVINERAEAVGPANRHQLFDVVTARAVASLEQLARWCMPLLKPGGKLLAMKGQKYIEELPAVTGILPRLGGGVPVIHPTPLPGAEHHVVVEIRKIRPPPNASKLRRSREVK